MVLYSICVHVYVEWIKKIVVIIQIKQKIEIVTSIHKELSRVFLQN